MGKMDIALKACISSNDRYADCFNAAVGRQILSPQFLQDMDLTLTGKEPGGRGVYDKRRDCVKLFCSRAICAIVCMENQTEIDYAMVARNFIYDAYSYHRQLLEIRNQHRQARDLLEDEFIGGFSHEDRIFPVITVCLYYGKKEWDASVHLHDILDFEGFPSEEREHLKALVQDYEMTVLDVRRMPLERLQNMETDMRQLFEVLRYAEDKDAMQNYISDKRDILSNLDEEIYNAIAALTDTEMLDEMLEQVRNEKGGMDMCKAFEELMADSKAEGKAEERKYSIQNLILTLREVSVDEETILEKLMQFYQLTREEGLAALQLNS